jgi:hypothetical protein
MTTTISAIDPVTDSPERVTCTWRLPADLVVEARRLARLERRGIADQVSVLLDEALAARRRLKPEQPF